MIIQESFIGGLDGSESTYNAGDQSSIPGSKRSLGEENGYPLQCSCLENFMNRDYEATVQWGCKELDMTEQAHMHNYSWT